MNKGITSPNQEYFKDGQWHWNGSVWIKGGLPFEYAEQIAGIVNEVDSAAGNVNLAGAAVAADEIWIITALHGRDFQTGLTGMFLGFNDGTNDHWAAASGALGAGVGFSWSGTIYLVEDDYPKARLFGCTLNDDIFFHYFGYKMRLI